MRRRPLVVLALALGAGGTAAGLTLTPSEPTLRACAYRALGALPDASCTPGVTNPAAASPAETICRPGWTKTVRPPASVTGRMKLKSMREYGASTDPRLYEYDHLIPLELGGAPLDERNLWPEPRQGPWINTGHDQVGTDFGAAAKDKVENALKRAVCAGRLPLDVAQRTIATDWRTAR